MRQTDLKNEIPSELTVEAEKLSNLGFGIAKQDGYVIFIEGACPKDKLKIKLYKKNKNFAHAKILEIIEPSPDRVKPFCPMSNVCGSCQLQFIDYSAQLRYKREIVIDTMRSISGTDVEVREVIPSPEVREYRHKIQYPVSQTKESKRIIAGYYKTSTHELVNIKYCPIQPSYCDEIIDFIRQKAQELGVSGYNEAAHYGLLRHVVIRASSYNGKALVVLVMNSQNILTSARELAKSIYEHFENVLGVGINYNTAKTNLILGKKTEILFGEGYIEESLCGKIFKVGADTFFQVNPKSADNIFRYVKDYISQNFSSPVLLDAYAGIGTFGIALSDVVKKAVCVEEVKSSIELAQKVINENGIKNVELHNTDAELFFEQELSAGKRLYDVTIFDPPRKGCSEKSLDYALKLTKEKIIYVSCNPSTLARDLKYLTEKGCKVEYIQPFDMFPHTYHIENVAIINVK